MMNHLIYPRPALSQWIVREGEPITCGQIIANGREHLHSAFAGAVERLTAGQLELRVDHEAQKPSMAPLEVEDPQTLQRIEAAGIVGLGGGGFPTYLKLLDALRQGVKRLVINAVECEPGISCDAALCEQQPETITLGIRALSALLGAEVHIAHSTATSLCPAEGNWQKHDVGTAKTPVGYERYLINTLFQTNLIHGDRPTHHNVVVINLGTAHAVGRAMQGWPLIGRMVSIEGQNRWLPIGKPFSELGLQGDLIEGGRLSGSAAGVAVGKTTNAIHVAQHRTSTPCINCAACNEACPEGLPVAQIVRTIKASGMDLERLHADRCIECGLCTPVCPSHIDVLAATRNARVLARAYIASERNKTEALRRFTAHEERRTQRLADKAARRQARLRRVRGRT